jgi:hypothetical protein
MSVYAEAENEADSEIWYSAVAVKLQTNASTTIANNYYRVATNARIVTPK